MTQLAFSKAVGHHNGVISRIRNGQRTPPLAAMEEWANVLGLKGAKKERFIELAEMAHAPERMVRRYLAMQERLRALEERVGKLERG